MITIENDAWQAMVVHTEGTFPKEGCGVMVGKDGVVRRAVALPNVYDGPQEDFFVMDPKDLQRVDEEARNAGEQVVGIYHSHPDCDAYFSKRDLEHSCPWYSYLVLSIRSGKFDHANSYRTDYDQTRADKEELVVAAHQR
jgi:proteasome lid subunit RPN8/RPN11